MVEVHENKKLVDYDWAEALLSLSERLEDMLDILGLKESARLVGIQRSILHGSIDSELLEQQAIMHAQSAEFVDPLVKLLKTLKKTGDERGDQRTLRDVAPIKSTMNDRVWRVGHELHASILKANQNGWLFYEIIGLMIENRDCWNNYELRWLIDVANDYIEGKI